ncbi:MAG: class I SAM-dependent methyltransferase [Burkholderiales bacterium]
MIPGTEGYAREAGQLVARYESIPQEEKHRSVVHLIAGKPRSVLDIGAGSGADAAWYASLGHCVVALEPVDALREAGMALHPSPAIEWLNDSLPGLELAASLLRESGVLIMALRHGPVPPGRRMFEASAQETIELAQAHGLEPLLSVRSQSIGALNWQVGVEWSRLAFRSTDTSGH